MNIKNFVSTALKEIALAVHEAKTDEEIKDKVVYGPAFGSREKPMRSVDFDIAVTVTEGSHDKVGGGIIVLGVLVGGVQKKETESIQNASRVKFSVPVDFCRPIDHCLKGVGEIGKD